MPWPDYWLGDLAPDVQAFWDPDGSLRKQALEGFKLLGAEELLPEEMGLCTCGVGNEYQVGHADYCDYAPPEVTAPDSNHSWPRGSWNPQRGKHGSWTCARCGYEAFRANAYNTDVAPMPDCPGKPP